jgi:hypothetical protein
VDPNRPAGAGTARSFRHRGFTVVDEAAAMTSSGSAYCLVSLTRYLEAGQGAPSPDVDFFRMLG